IPHGFTHAAAGKRCGHTSTPPFGALAYASRLGSSLLTKCRYMHYTEAMSMPSLTARQTRLLQFIEDSLSTRGYVPTLQEMAHAMGIASLYGVKRHVVALERKGYIRRFPSRRRAIELIQRITQIGRA